MYSVHILIYILSENMSTATAIHLLQLIGSVGFSGIVAIVTCGHLHWNPYNPFAAIQKSHSQSHRVNSP